MTLNYIRVIIPKEEDGIVGDFVKVEMCQPPSIIGDFTDPSNPPRNIIDWYKEEAKYMERFFERHGVKVRHWIEKIINGKTIECELV